MQSHVVVFDIIHGYMNLTDYGITDGKSGDGMHGTQRTMVDGIVFIAEP